MPFFSIIIPTFNRAKLLNKAIASVLAQSYQSFEVIVVDDGSTDETAEVVHSFRDPRIVYLYQNNSGGGAARNFGIKASSGRYIAFLDSDDEFRSDKLQVIYDELTRRGDAVYYSRAEVRRPGGVAWVRPSRGKAEFETCLEYFFCAGEVMSTITLCLPAAWAKTVMFDECLRRHQDYDFCWRLEVNGYPFFFITDVLAYWNDDNRQDRISRALDSGPSLIFYEKIRPSAPLSVTSAFEISVLSKYYGYGDWMKVILSAYRAWMLGSMKAGHVCAYLFRFLVPLRAYRFFMNIGLWFISRMKA